MATVAEHDANSDIRGQSIDVELYVGYDKLTQIAEIDVSWTMQPGCCQLCIAQLYPAPSWTSKGTPTFLNNDEYAQVTNTKS